MNWLLNILNKLLNNRTQEDTWQRISTPVRRMNADVQIKNIAQIPDSYTEQLFHQKVSMIEQSLRVAKDQAQNINKAVENIPSKPESIEEAIKDIIRHCDTVSLNGIQILSGEPIHLKYQQQELVIQLPSCSKEILNLSEDQNSVRDVNQKVNELNLAIDASLENLQKFLTKIETSQQNYLSAGIDLKLFQNQVTDA